MKKRFLDKPRTDEELKKEYERVFNYDPTDEEVAAKYDENFEEELYQELTEKLNNKN